MDERGSLDGFLVSKVGIAFAVFLMMGMATFTYKSFDRELQRGELDSVVEHVVNNLNEVDSLPGRVRLERSLPPIKKPYEMIVTGSYRDCQKVEIRIRFPENIRCAFFLESKVNGGEFEIRRENPRKIILRKTDRINLEVI